MATLFDALLYIFRQRGQIINFGNADGALKDVRYDEPLPKDFVPPTQDEVDAALAYLADPVPDNVTSPQLTRALYAANLFTIVDDACNQVGGLALALWTRSPVFTRADPMINAIGQVAGLTSKQIDDLFRAASKYP